MVPEKSETLRSLCDLRICIDASVVCIAACGLGAMLSLTVFFVVVAGQTSGRSSAAVPMGNNIFVVFVLVESGCISIVPFAVVNGLIAMVVVKKP